MFPSVPNAHLRGIKPSDLFPPLWLYYSARRETKAVFCRVAWLGTNFRFMRIGNTVMVNETFPNYDDQMQPMKILAKIKKKKQPKNCDMEED
ncbi:hypothetical protein CDAR_390731 [Caerostris darwini]|uniref:Uncharacterized protein n=1 Tax=Caerostris darwini TaxID=1538125 RepID=A0AAV4MNS3_9ARAC|nr:hypothetical protein CDAR_390731 [Caerostris darwini]